MYESSLKMEPKLTAETRDLILYFEVDEKDEYNSRTNLASKFIKVLTYNNSILEALGKLESQNVKDLLFEFVKAGKIVEGFNENIRAQVEKDLRAIYMRIADLIMLANKEYEFQEVFLCHRLESPILIEDSE